MTRGAPAGMGARGAVAVALVATLGWQLYLALAARRNAPLLERVLEGFGGELPAVTEAFLRWHELLALLPAATAIAGLWVLRRAPLRWYASMVVAVALGVTLALQAWIHEAFLQPLLRLIEAVG